MTITNGGNETLQVSDVRLTGNNASCFEVTGSVPIIITANGETNTTYKIQPKAGLDSGIYTAMLVVLYKKDGDTQVTDNWAVADVVFTVDKADSVAATVTPNNPVYDGQKKLLVTVNESALAGGDMHYALSTDATPPRPSGYSPAIPTARRAGTYYVWYRVRGDNNHRDTEPEFVPVTISKADRPTPADLNALYGTLQDDDSHRHRFAVTASLQREGLPQNDLFISF